MKTTNKNNKALYIAPAITTVRLDNEISLILASTGTPPYGPNEGGGTSLEQLFDLEEQSNSPWE